MLSTNSLQAFSASNTAPLQGSGPVRVVREQAAAQQRQTGTAPKPILPDAMPSTKLPRGSLLNLSV